MKKSKLLLLCIALLGNILISSCKKDDYNSAGMTIASRTISEYVVIDPDFSILLQALKKADLADLLDGEGNFTLFAPDNYAFEAFFDRAWRFRD